MFNFITEENAEDWRPSVEYFINVAAFVLSVASLTLLANQATPLFWLYPAFCLLRLGFYHFKKPQRGFGALCGFFDLAFVLGLIHQAGFSTVHYGVLYSVITLHALRFRATQTLSLGVMSILGIISLGFGGVLPANPVMTFTALALFTALFTMFSYKAEAVLNGAIANKKATKAIKAAQSTLALKSKVMSEMSGDLKTPMDSVLSVSKALRKTPLSTEQKQYVEVLETSGHTLLSAIENIMDFTQMESGALTSKLEDLDLNETLRHVAKSFGSKARRKGLDFLINVHPGSQMALTGYEKRLRQIINSLVDNAIKFTSKGHVILDVSSKPINAKLAQLVVTISDSGLGLSKTQIETILKGATSPNQTQSSRGLGLKIVQMLLGVQGEALHVESVQGEGTTFSFELHMPYRKEVSEPNPLVSVSSKLRGLRTLIVNDLPEESDYLQTALNHAGLMPQIVDNAESACQAINAAHNADRSYNLILIDYDMPEFDGLKLVELIRSREELDAMQIIALSSSDEASVEKAFFAFEGTQYLLKPYSQLDLQKAIATVVKDNYLPQATTPKKVA